MMKKAIVAAAVAMFCISALAIVFDSNESAADDAKLTYSFYLDLNNGTDTYKGRLADVEVEGASPTGDTYGTALAAACTAAGLTLVNTGSWVTSITDTADHLYESSPYGDWGTANYKNFAVYYYKDGAWATASDFTESTMIAIVFGGYAFSEPSDASKYYKNEYEGSDPYWTPLPSCDVVEYKVYFQLNDNDGSSFSKWIYSTQFSICGNSLKSARALAGKEAGITVVNSSGATSLTSVTADGHTYAKHGSYGGDEYYNFAAYYGTENDEWSDLQAVNLETATVIAHVFDLYKFADPQDDSYFFHPAAYGMDPYWTKAPTVDPSDADGKDKKDNKVLFIGIGAGVAAVVVIGVVAVFIMKRKA